MMLRRVRKTTITASLSHYNSHGYAYGLQFPHDRRNRGFSTAPEAGKDPIRKILVANRGEIACRIMRTAKNLGLRTVSVYSEADKNSLHVSMADEAVCIGPPEAKFSYLNTEAILDASRRARADAIHPGYGFLSENSRFAELCKQEGFIFIGPPVNAIRAMGDKSESKTLMSAAGVPVVPGYHGEEQDAEFLKSQADKIGYPVIIKATQGGGGKGMKIVSSPDDFLENLFSAQREALASFGDKRVLVEKYIQEPRHIEVQIFGDQHGNVVHLFERDCSVQRRHQKIIEEAPAPKITDKFRQQIGEAAVAAAKAVGYYNAGTVEFIVDSISKDFFFMEMNTRLQVEHPITEMITKKDLVEWQIRVANGEPLPCQQNDLLISGHSFEARIYAENIESGFLPASGVLHHYKPPDTASTIRVETGVQEGDAVSIYYDPMIAKLVVWGHDRSSALLKLHDCLSKFQVSGIPTNIEFLKKLSQHHAFAAGDVGTHFIERYKESLLNFGKVEEQCNLGLAIAACYLCMKGALRPCKVSSVNNKLLGYQPWASLNDFRLNHDLSRHIILKDGLNREVEVLVTCCKDGSYRVKVHGEDKDVSLMPSLEGNEFKVSVDGVTRHASAAFYKKDTDYILDIWSDDMHHEFLWVTPDIDTESVEAELLGGGQAHQRKMSNVPSGGVCSPMSGRLVRVLVENGSKVNKGDPLVILEAMKMEHVVRAPRDGHVNGLTLEAGENIKDNALLLVIGDQV